MVGNDIVDLEEAKKASNWQRPRFLDKLFTSKEQQLIHNSKNAFLMVWRLWTMKEAAYKLYTQLHPSRFYNPKGFECFIDNGNGTVRFKDFHCHTKTQIESKYIVSEARLTEDKMTSKVIKFKENSSSEKQGNLIKNRVLHALSKLNKVPVAHLKFKKSEFGIPAVHFNSETIEISMSHHGCFGAYAI